MVIDLKPALDEEKLDARLLREHRGDTPTRTSTMLWRAWCPG
ncbi:MAG: hypothetical protein ACLT9P_10305 [Evtepia gabavorous]